MSKKVLAIIEREYVTRAKTKGFIIGTILFPIILVLLFSGIFIVRTLFKPSTRTYYIVDQTGMIFDEFARIQSGKLKNGEPKYRFTLKKVPSDSMEASLETFQSKVMQKEIYGYLIIPEDVVESRKVRYSAKNVSDFEEQESFSRTLSWIVTNYRLKNKGLPADEIRKEMDQGKVSLVSHQVTEKGEIKKSGISSYILTYILTYVMFLMMMIYGQILMRSVIEEKSQRITESIVSAIKPLELMFGKIVGVCGLGLTQLVIFGGFMLAAVTYAEPLFRRFGLSSPEFLRIIRQLHFTAPVFGFMILFFLLGFVFYSGLYAALGAMVNTEDEGQQYQMPLIFFFIMGYFIMFTVAQNPDTARAFWVSLFPPFTPMVMFARIAVSDPMIPSGAYLSILTMVISTAILIYIVSKIYRVGILMYGKKPSIKEAIKWIRYK
ncbi:MAG: ABC transporter permease [Candidatus Aminicenantes bacterium]|nr:MAG: ABC transporter permease [Candidatus Aminicenantes bacterium]